MKIQPISDKLFFEVKSQFEKNYKLNNDFSVVVAVSGGADSMVLFHILNRLSKEIGFKITGITVNHNIRPKDESLADVLLVEKFAKENDIQLKIHQFQPGFIEEVRKERKKGIEEAARFCRYKVFEEYTKAIKADCLCLAHNQNDNLETLIQRFLQGSVLKAGIKQKRGIYFRPLLNITRKEIEEYALENKIPYCIDATNLENNYLRNKIRNQLVPVLDLYFDGWKTGVLNGEKKVFDVEKLIENTLRNHNWTFDKKNKNVFFDFQEFVGLEKSIKINLLYKGLETFFAVKKNGEWENQIEKNDRDFVRFPYYLLEKFVSDFKPVDFENVKIFCDSENILIGNVKKGYDNIGFYTIIDSVGFYDLPFGKIQIEEKSKNRFVAKLIESDFVSGEFLLPVVIRSKDNSDFIEDKNKNKKDVTKIFSEWKVLEEDFSRIPIFCDVKIRGIWGKPFNAENFFVRIDEDL